jgi:hypothetical protein
MVAGPWYSARNEVSESSSDMWLSSMGVVYRRDGGGSIVGKKPMAISSRHYSDTGSHGGYSIKSLYEE